MDWLDHEYLVPIIIGNSKEALSIAKKLKRFTHKKAIFFADKSNVLMRSFCKFRKIAPFRKEFLLSSLTHFADELEDYEFPVLIYGDDTADLILDDLELLESRFLVVSFETARTLIFGG